MERSLSNILTLHYIYKVKKIRGDNLGHWTIDISVNRVDIKKNIPNTK